MTHTQRVFTHQEKMELFLFFFVVGVSLYGMFKFFQDELVTDVSGSQQVSLVETVDTPTLANASKVFVADGYAYLAMKSGSSGELHIVNVTDPTNATLVGSLEVGADVNDVVVSGNFAYLATSNASREVIVANISNKSAPSIAGQYNIPDTQRALSVALVYPKLYIGAEKKTGSGKPEFRVFDVTSSKNIVSVGTFDPDADINSIVLEDNVALLATSDATKELIKLNVSNPAAISQVAVANLAGAGPANSVARSGSTIVVGKNNQSGNPDFFVLNDGGSSLPVVGSLNLGTQNNDVKIFGSVVFVGTNTSAKGLVLVDITNPAQPVQSALLNTGTNVGGVFVAAGHAYLATEHNQEELQIVDHNVASKPNIIIILTDDQRWDTMFAMPFVNQYLTQQGVKFDNAFLNTSLCCPDRATILTGQFTHNHGVRGNGGATLFDDSSTLPIWLQDVGYKTGIFGKYMNQTRQALGLSIPPGWDDWQVFLDGTENYYNYAMNENGVEVDYGSDPEDYSTDVLLAKTLNFIDENANQPFFLMLTPFAPHSTSIAAPRHVGEFSGYTWTDRPNVNEEDISDKPLYIHAYQSTFGGGGPVNIDGYLESLQAVDEAVRDISNLLEQKGIADNTLIIFTSDNGYYWGEHWLTGKNWPYDESLRAPFIVRYPELVPSAFTSDELISHVDIAPTILELSGATAGLPQNGQSFKQLLEGNETGWKQDTFFEHYSAGFFGTPTKGVRTKDWKYIKTTADTGITEELYDLNADPYEMENVAAVPANATILNQLRARFEQLLAE